MSATGKHAGSKPPSLLASSAWMAAGTVVSRLTGFGRAAVIAMALGLATTADVFNVPNVIPNMLYILVGGGVLNSVLVPALVRAIKSDPDGGEAFSQRLFSLTITVLGAATVLAVLAAPLLVRLVVDSRYLEPDMQPYFDNMVMFARFCLPQIFFYGVYVMIGQILNARGRFGPMMWAPILNNVIAIATFVVYMIGFGTKGLVPFTSGEVQLLGIGSTLAVAAQAFVLMPVLRNMGFSLRFRTDWRGQGLGEPIRLGAWSVGFVVVNQIAYLFFVSTATGASAAAATGGDDGGVGYTAYAYAMLIMMVPHAVITVSLATALLPRLSDQLSNGHVDEARDQLVSGMRACLSIIVPCAALMAVLAGPLAALLFSHGAAEGATSELASTLIALLPGLLAFTVHYLCLRGFFALQDTRTPFFTQLWIAGVMVFWAIGMSLIDPPGGMVTTLLGVGYTVAYLVGAALSAVRLQREIGQVDYIPIARHFGRLLAASVAAALVAWLTHVSVGALVDGIPLIGGLLDIAFAGAIGAAAFVGLAHVLGIAEVRDAIGMVQRKLKGGGTPEPVEEYELEETAEHPPPESPSWHGVFRKPALDPNATMEFVLDETMHGATMHGVSGGEQQAAGVGEGKRYRLLTLLDESVGAETWLGWDAVLRRQVMVQVVPAQDARATALVQAAQRASTLADPHFLRVLDVGTDDMAYVVQEWTPGERLSDALARGALTAGDAQAIEHELSQAFAAAHAHGLYHERLTPDHVYLAPGGAVKVRGLETEAALFGPGGGRPDPAAVDAAAMQRVVDACYDGFVHEAGADAADEVVPGLYESVGVRRGRRERRAKQGKRAIGVVVAIAVLIAATLVSYRVLVQSDDSGSTSDSTSEDSGDEGDVSEEGSDTGDEPGEPTGTPTETPSPTDTPSDLVTLEPAGAQFYDPDGGTPENPEQAENAIDGDPETTWSTLTYYDPIDLLKSGVGLYVDLGEQASVSTVDVQLAAGDAAVELRVGADGDVPGGIDGWELADSVDESGQDVTFELDEPVTARYVLIWFTRLPETGNEEWSNEIAEVTVSGAS